jgi:hypothetical protein
MQKNAPRKLILRRSSVRALIDAQLGAVAAGAMSRFCTDLLCPADPTEPPFTPSLQIC